SRVKPIKCIFTNLIHAYYSLAIALCQLRKSCDLDKEMRDFAQQKLAELQKYGTKSSFSP
ncbi:hypothetical protein, partial [Nostoc sp.]|uniref:hypothetical protein n=1 Tax=Nostoc sp. TaxID=1180 RepID=UPI002FF8102E